MSNFISEDHIEKAAKDLFVDILGYRHLNCHVQDLTGRQSESDVVIKPLLRKKLQELNKDLPESAIEEAFNILVRLRTDMSEVLANKEIYEYLKTGVQVTITNSKGKEEPVYVKVIDFDNEKRNDFLVVSQLWIQGQYIRRRPDLIVFVNGLPLVFIELKNSNIALRNAYDDNLTNYRKDIPLLYHYNVCCILSNGLETKVGSITSGWEHFFLWLRDESENQKIDKQRIREFGVSLNYAVLGICRKEKLLDYTENFILYFNDAIKIIAKNHQFLGVNNAIDNFSLRLKHDKEGTDKENKGKLGVFWHTQGSGKSYSMIFFSRKVFRKFTGNYTFLIVTDRDDLDGQIYGNFLGAGVVKKNDRCRPNDSEELREMLQGNRKFIFTLIQKFRYPKGKAYPKLSERNDIIVIVDEAHRTQYKDLAENMRVGLSDAQYIAFTGTPLLGSKKMTEDWFGENISEYNFKQSIEDGATVPLYYQKRKPEVHLQNDEMDNDLAEIVADENLTDAQKEKLENEFAQELSVIKRDSRLEVIAEDIAWHFPRRGYLGKAMVVCIDKFTAVKMYDKVRRHLEEERKNYQIEYNKSKNPKEKEELKRILEWLRRLEMAVVVSEEAGEEEKFRNEGLDIRPHRLRMQSLDDNGQDLEDKFKNPKDTLQLVFVCSMWLTGFDAPTVSTLYMDKPMKDHTLMQTIARANRVTDFAIYKKPKRSGLIVDYYGVFGNMRKAFASYGGGSIGGAGGTGEDVPVQEKDQLFVLLAEAISACENYCLTKGVELNKIVQSQEVFTNLALFDEFADTLVAIDETKKQFIVYDNTIDALYEACRPEILNRKNEFPLRAVIHYLREIIDGLADRGNVDSAKRRISQLLDDSIIANSDSMNTETENKPKEEEAVAESKTEKYKITAWKQIDLSKFDIEKLREEFKEAKYKHIEIADLRLFIENKLQLMMRNNSTRIGFAQRLQNIIDRYNSGGSTTEDYYNDLTNYVAQLREEDMRATKEGLSEKELQLFDLLKKEKLTKEEGIAVKNAAKNLLKRLKEEKPTVLINDWYKDTQTKLQVESAINQVLENYLPQSYDKEIFKEKRNAVYEHFLMEAVNGNQRSAA